MDIHVQNNPHLHYGVNGAHDARHSEDNELQFLSLEEKECILFFEETIESLEEGFEDEKEKLPSGDSIPEGEFPPSPKYPDPSGTRSPSPKENDIIDLVNSTPDFTAPREPLTEPLVPDFQSMTVAPEAHFELKAKRDPMENFPQEYNIPQPAAPPDQAEDTGYQPPPGSIPTPVVIANKIAEHNVSSSGTSAVLPSVLIQRRRSLESPRSPTSPTEQHIKQGPPTSAKPTRLPSNITMMMNNREHTPQSLAMAAVSAQERRAQMLANLTGSSHPLEGGEPACVRKLPTRSVSFRDPTPDKSRMEALSKLGLTRDRAQSLTPGPRRESDKTSNSQIHTSINTQTQIQIQTDTNSSTSSSDEKPIVSEPSTGSKTEMGTSNFSSYGGKTIVVTPSVTSQGKPTPGNHDNHTVAPAPTGTEVSFSDFNSYGGKTIVVTPAGTSKNDSLATHTGIATQPRSEVTECQPNSYGGKSRVVIPAVAKNDSPDAPDGRNRTESMSIPVTSNLTETSTSELNSYGGKSKVFTPATASTTATNTLDAPTPKTIVRTRPASLPPNPAPRPLRRGSGPSPHRERPSPPSPEVRRKLGPKPSFRSQGITVQFSGRGATDEARREALRKLGLLKDTS
ncbi:proline and serine-rich protein 2 [Chanos chanos]|uniref:Proline and serine-rich protein 2 n=1 Tax=Chanos chanos TaxID=29144 RepID=A0A6J2VSL0_CHACN|nr:proline and serine-rich protein 2 [Chanos chanos]